MKKILLFLIFTLLYFTPNLVSAEMSCATFAKELGLASWHNQGLCSRVKSTTDHACYNFEVNKRHINCNSTTIGWSCKSSYIKSGDSCIKQYIPANAYKTSDGWNCFSQYFINRNTSSCQKIPDNATKTSDFSFKCNSRYSKNSGGNSCIKTTTTSTSPTNIPPNASSSGFGWLCDYNYYINSSRKGCVRVPANAFSPSYKQRPALACTSTHAAHARRRAITTRWQAAVRAAAAELGQRQAGEPAS